MDYDKIPQDLPVEIVALITSYIDLTTPSALAIKTAEIREIKNIELLSKHPSIGVIKLNDDLDQDYNHYNNSAHYIFNGDLDY
tara:strand:+ start:791 stop:1039 length:249 start_codon:yes stop_codon:yes gene_type:complete